MYQIPYHYRQQIQTGLAFSGPDVNKGLFIDTYFRICKLNDLEPSLKHNQWLNGGNIYETKEASVLAWGVCYLYSKHNLVPNENKIIDIAEGQKSTFFRNIMTSIMEKSIWCSYGKVRTAFTKEDENNEFLRKIHMEKAFDWAQKNSEKPKPVAVFAWKLLGETELWLPKTPNFLEKLQSDVEYFQKNLEKLKKTLNDFVYEEEYHPKPTIIENTGDDTDFLMAFLENNTFVS